jgi:hypothetical protein
LLRRCLGRVDEGVGCDRVGFRLIIHSNDGIDEGQIRRLGEDQDRVAPDSHRDKQRYSYLHAERIVFGSISGYVGTYNLDSKKTSYFEQIDEELIRGVTPLLSRSAAGTTKYTSPSATGTSASRIWAGTPKTTKCSASSGVTPTSSAPTP